MKLTGRNARVYFSKPEPERAGLLIYGADPMRVALKRQEVIQALIGKNGEEEMRLTRIPASELRSDPALLMDAIKAQGFFPGPRVAFVEDAADGLSKTIGAAMQDWQPGDAQIIVTAKQLPARSSLRKAFETHNNAYAVGIYDDPPDRDEIEAELRKAGLSRVDQDAMAGLIAFSRSLDPGDFRQLIVKLGLFKTDDPNPLSAEEITALAPTSSEAALDDILNAVAEARTGEIGPILRKLEAQGMQPVGLCIGATRHFRALHQVASGAPVRPPLFGPRRDRMHKQARSWGFGKLERALEMLVDTDLQLRSTSRAPAMALIERTLIRLSMMGRR